MSTTMRDIRAIAVLIAAVAVLLVGPGAAHAARAAGPYCPEALDLKAAERLDTHRLVGKSLRRARRIARRNECEVRVVRRDGVSLPVTDDYVTNRINVAVRGGIVKRVLGVY